MIEIHKGSQENLEAFLVLLKTVWDAMEHKEWFCLDSPEGEVIGYAELDTKDAVNFHEFVAGLEKKVSGKHDLYFVFSGDNFELEYWYCR